MSNSLFNANSWINLQELAYDKAQAKAISPILAPAAISEIGQFAPADFLIPNWKGQGLISQDALDISKKIEKLKGDARSQLFEISFNPSFQQAIYDEFFEFAHSNNLILHNIAGSGAFWKNLKDPNSSVRVELDHFVEHYTHRVVVIYLYKLKFLTLLADSLEIPLTKENLLNANSFINGIFKQGGSTQLSALALQNNKYSWYLPSRSLADDLVELSPKLLKITITETMKISSFRRTSESETLCFHDNEYSHALSHQAFGFFVNHLMINFPKWLNRDYGCHPSFKHSLNTFPKAVNCKFQGKYLSSLILSHWLAQKACIDEKWDQIICPDCVLDEYSNSDFIRICHELQLMHYLISFAKVQKMELVSFLCKVMKERQQMKVTAGQLPLLLNSEKCYDRILLNVDLPKTNPHPHLINQIKKQRYNISANGLLFVFSNQRLLVPSQKNKIEQLFKEFKLEANFNFENLKGRGEIPQYLFVFSPISPADTQQDVFSLIPPLRQHASQKESCFTFHLSGELPIFADFMKLVDELANFLKKKEAFSTPFYSQQLSENLSFRFFQDTIVDGTLHSLATDSSVFTHPKYFENINKTCVPLEHMFNINELENRDIAPADLFGSNGLPVVILIVNLTDPKNIKLELSGGETFLSKRNQLGMACYRYFGLSPKLSGLNLNLFREYFESHIGKQVIQICLTSTSKIKAQLNALLIPEFFTHATIRAPEELLAPLGVLALANEEILKQSPLPLLAKLQELQPTILGLAKNYPWEMMGRLSHFKINVTWCLEKFKKSESSITNLNFSNPLLFKPLMKVASNSLLEHPDIHVKLLKSPQDLYIEQLRLDAENNDLQNEKLTLVANGEDVVEIYASPEILRFVRFILQNTKGHPLHQLLTHLRVPFESDLKDIIKSFFSQEEGFEKLHQLTDKLIVDIINGKISI